MRTDSFSSEKHLPVRRFIADESKVATGLYGPRAIADDIDNIHAMFDPETELLSGTEKGGISEKNLQDGAVSFQKLHPDVQEKITGSVSVKQLEEFQKEYAEKLEGKAETADSLDGYGIKDAYNKEEIDGFLAKVSETVANKTEETVLYEDVLNTPEWTNQPTYEGTLDSAFNTTDFYYVTLKDVDGNALPEGKFMLKSTFDTTATVYPTVFALADLNTGTSTLVENFPVEFTAIDTQVRMRDAGVWKITYTPENWKLNGNRGQLRLVCDGQFIQRTANAYFVNMCSVNKNVSHYHSMSSTAFQSDATKQIICYAALSGSYKTNKFYDDMVIERVSDTCYATKRNVTIRYIKNASSDYTVSSCQVFGHGEISADTGITELCIQVAADSNRGFIRNGSVIRVTEVK